jgi:uncharacterized protein (DUF1697 family)
MERSSLWQVALLRGVNVGPGKRVPMADLRAIAEECGFLDVRTHLNSGNVVYRASTIAPATAERRLRAGIFDRCSVDTPVLVRTREQLERAIAENPMPAEAAAQPSKFVVMFWHHTMDDAKRALIAEMPVTVEQVAVGAHAAYLYFPDGLSASKPFELLGRQLGDGVTSRNWNTVTSLLALMSSP